MSAVELLPAAFRDLDPLAAAGWCGATEQERLRKRHASSPGELNAFYETFGPRLEEVIVYLDEKGSRELEGGDKKLMLLLLSMAEVAFAVEKFDADESSYHGIAAERFTPVHELRDGGLPVPDEYR